MCGIAGYYNLNGAPADPVILRRMMDIQRHRGPDDQALRLFSLKSGQSREVGNGAWEHCHGGFEGAVGFNRLAIIDLSERGRQPMANPEGSVLIAFNGEIYNAAEHREQLESAGFRFRSRTDTEVLLYLYEHLGLVRMLDCLEGMFAMCIVDLRQGEIHLARDPFGIKPLYWVQQEHTFLFSSEVKSFLLHPQFRARVDADALDEYLTFRYCAGERFLLEGVRQFPPGHRLRLTLGGWQMYRYWQIPDFTEKVSGDQRSVIDKLDALLHKSVTSRLVSDVRIGCQLSGGIDSTLVTLYARPHVPGDLDVFSIVMRQTAYCEEPWMSQVAQAVPVRRHSFQLDEPYVLDHLARATWHLDQPLNVPNSVGIYLLAERARPWVTVLLSGEGADELLGGYERFYQAAIRQRVGPWLRVLASIPGPGARAARRLKCRLPPADAFILSQTGLSPRRLMEVRPEANFERAMDVRRAIFAQGQADYLSNCLKYDMQTYMVDLLVRQDKMTMAHSLETRVPFLDRELVSFVRSLPVEHLVRARILAARGPARNTKLALKELARRTFDDAFVYRPKCGFLLPLSDYFVQPRFAEMMEDQLLPGMQRRGWLQEPVVRRWWHECRATPGKGARRLWTSMALEIWAQLFLDRSGTDPNIHPPQRTPTSVSV